MIVRQDAKTLRQDLNEEYCDDNGCGMRKIVRQIVWITSVYARLKIGNRVSSDIFFHEGTVLPGFASPHVV